jgi:hypothetical protein
MTDAPGVLTRPRRRTYCRDMTENQVPKCVDGCRKEDPTAKAREDECDSCGRPEYGPTLCDKCAVKYHRIKPVQSSEMYRCPAEDL